MVCIHHRDVESLVDVGSHLGEVSAVDITEVDVITKANHEVVRGRLKQLWIWPANFSVPRVKTTKIALNPFL